MFIFNIGKPMTHRTRKTVKFITVLHYLTNLHHVISKTVYFGQNVLCKIA